jgi:hypothetical protein
MKKLIIIILLLFLFGCISHHGIIRSFDKPICQRENCVQVLIIIYNSHGIFEEVQFFLGVLRKSYLPIYKGTACDLEYMGNPPLSALCVNPVKLKWGFYQVWYGSQLVVGEGYGDTIYIRNINFLPLMIERR